MTAARYFSSFELLPDDWARTLDAPFWEGLRSQRILVQRCSVCHAEQIPAEHRCKTCGLGPLGWREVAPEGRIFTYSVVWHASHPMLQSEVPYLVAVVEVGSGARVVGNILGDPRQEIEIGWPVEAVFEEHEPSGVTLLQWRLTGGSAGVRIE